MILRSANGKFIKGNNSGRRFSQKYSPWDHPNNEKTRFKVGESHPNWKGDNVGETAIHDWLKKKLGKANCCQNIDCPCKSKTFDWANTRNHKYRRVKTDFIMLCRSCHFKFDRGTISIRTESSL